jgi:hypothetical protein
MMSLIKKYYDSILNPNSLLQVRSGTDLNADATARRSNINTD